ncbi:hypothetical protein [Pseudoduganella umbonata]|uniref:Uncharacterized protein n=2 Tax=Pseudoduganella umbonata TaxID=864828 RepID=A0A4P8HPB8_9BURK|nr:hypothetical protein [Pseudoduganella umbonata]MBB3221125.1 hypothetical protein [Pseudoduganella umbonata]QCP10318.1 hypothetical protein FCL38_07670 [Pseudoduganella umbonata]
MPRSARLANIANGLCGSFISRNNDVDGYWAIGKLRLLAGQHEQSAVSLDVLASAMQPLLPGFEPGLAHYRGLLAKLAGCSGIPPEEITAARIEVDFAPPPWPRIPYYEPQCGEQYVLTVTVSAEGRADGIVRHAGYCRPHDPTSERRSTRPSGPWPPVELAASPGTGARA